MRKLLSLVIPIYNEEKNIAALYREIQGVFSGLPECSFEIVFVNDGSRDNSVLELLKLSEQDQRVKVLDFSRNFGKEAATSAGCHHAQGAAVITMDADLQHPPRLIGELIRKWEEGFEVVYTVRKENTGASLTKRITSQMYWWIFDRISSVKTEPHSTDFRLLDRKVVDVFRNFPERGRLFRGIVDWMGYKRAKVEFVAAERNEGVATYSYRKLLLLAVNSITAFSLLPLRLAGYLGILITSVSSLLLIFMAASDFFVSDLEFTPLAFVAVTNTLLIGLVLICLGFIALYIARIHEEVAGRPLYIIREKINL